MWDDDSMDIDGMFEEGDGGDALVSEDAWSEKPVECVFKAVFAHGCCG